MKHSELNDKKWIGLPLILTIALLLFVRCSKDEVSSPKAAGIVTVDGVDHDLSNAVLKFYGNKDYFDASTGEVGTLCRQNLLLYSKYVLTSTDEQGQTKFSGQGSAIQLNLYCTDKEGLTPGNYSFRYRLSSNIPPFSFIGGLYIIDHDFSIREANGIEITDGMVIVEKNGNTYNIEFDCLCRRGKNLMGQYKGTLSYVDISDEWDSISDE